MISSVPSPQEPAALANALAALDQGAILLEEACREIWSVQTARSDRNEMAMANALRDLRHEVRNPLGGMRGLAGLLERELEVRPSTPNATRLLQALRQRAEATSEALERGAAAADLCCDGEATDAPAPEASERPPLPIRAVLWNLVRNAAEIGALGRSAALGASVAPAPAPMQELLAAPPAAPMHEILAPPPPTAILDAVVTPAPEGTPSGVPDADPIITLLRQRGVNDAFAQSLGAGAREMASHPDELPDGLRRALTAALTPARLLDLPGRRSVVVLGPSGSGKTSTLAKLAAEAVSRGQQPVLVCADGESITGEDALGAVAEALSLPLESAYSEAALEEVVVRHGADRMVLVDTPGRSPEEPGAVESLRALIQAAGDPVVLLVASASTETDELHRFVHGFGTLGIDGLVVTRLDETARPGRLLNFTRTLPTPIAWVTFGRSARGAAAPPNDARVIARILGPALAIERVA